MTKKTNKCPLSIICVAEHGHVIGCPIRSGKEYHECNIIKEVLEDLQKDYIIEKIPVDTL